MKYGDLRGASHGPLLPKTPSGFRMKAIVYVLSIRQKEDESVQGLCDSIASAGREAKVVRGVVGRDLTAGEYFDSIRAYLADTKRLMSPGEVGCTLGHLKIWSAIANDSAKMGVVLEDDAMLDDQFGARLEALLDYCAFADCFVSLGGQESSLSFTKSLRGRRINELQDTWEIFPSELSRLYGTVGYVVSRTTASRMVAEAAKRLFVADDFGLLHRSGAIRRLLLSNVVGHPWGDHHSLIGNERDFLFATAQASPRPLLKRLAQEVLATISSRLTLPDQVGVEENAELLEWNSRFRRTGG